MIIWPIILIILKKILEWKKLIKYIWVISKAYDLLDRVKIFYNRKDSVQAIVRAEKMMIEDFFPH